MRCLLTLLLVSAVPYFGAWAAESWQNEPTKVQQTAADTLLLEYLSTFDPHSLGKNLVTEDRGQLKLHPFSNP